MLSAVFLLVHLSIGKGVSHSVCSYMCAFPCFPAPLSYFMFIDIWILSQRQSPSFSIVDITALLFDTTICLNQFCLLNIWLYICTCLYISIFPIIYVFLYMIFIFINISNYCHFWDLVKSTSERSWVTSAYYLPDFDVSFPVYWFYFLKLLFFSCRDFACAFPVCLMYCQNTHRQILLLLMLHHTFSKTTLF